MGKGIKTILFLAAGLAGGYLLLKGKSLISFVEQLKITPRIDGGVKRINFKNSSLNIPVALDFENNTEQEITVSISNVILKYNNVAVGSLKPNTQKVLIKKNAKSTLSNIVVAIPLSNLIQCIGSMAQSLITTQNYNEIVKKISADVTCILNNTLVYEFIEKFGETNKVNPNNGKTVSGLGLVANKVRTIQSLKEYQHLIPPQSELQQKGIIMIPDATVNDTVSFMHKVAKTYSPDTSELAKTLKRDNLKDTIQAIFDFVYEHIQYVPDNKLKEQVRRPLRTLYDQKGDCDCYATLIGSILTNLNIPFKFRIAAYNGKPYYQHVYVIVPYSGGYYVCDPVLDTCFTEKTPSKYLDI